MHILSMIFSRNRGQGGKAQAGLWQSTNAVQSATPVMSGMHGSGGLIGNRYEVRKVLTGGMGVVYLCLDRQTDSPVALKTFQPQFLSNREARERFLREATVWVDLGFHPHIVRAYGVEYDAHRSEVYLVLEWVAEAEHKPDASLQAWITPGQPLPVGQALLFALHIARGMKYAMAKIPGLIHRDLKPANVLVGRDGNARVTDFGLARILAESDKSTWVVTVSAEGILGQTLATHGRVIGTPEYMPPEQFEGKAVSGSDIYAFGVMTYQMLTGRLPFQMPEDMHPAARAYFYRHAHQTEPACPIGISYPQELQQLVMACLERDSGARPGSFAEIEAILARTYHQAIGKDAPAELGAEGQTEADRVAKGWSYNSLGWSYYDLSKYDVAVRYFERVVQIAVTEKNDGLKIAGLGSLGGACWKLGGLQRAMDAYEKCLALAREIGSPNAEGKALNGLGNIYEGQGDVRRAIEFFDQALAIARLVGDRSDEAHVLNDKGNAHADLGDMSQAIQCHEQALSIATEVGDRAAQCRALQNLGVDYGSNSAAARRAISCFEGALVIATDIGNRLEVGTALGNLGLVYADLGDAKRALGFYEKHLAVAQEISDMAGVGRTSFNLARLLDREGQHAEALGYAENAAQAFARAGHLQLVEMARRLIAQLQDQGR